METASAAIALGALGSPGLFTGQTRGQRREKDFGNFLGLQATTGTTGDIDWMGYGNVTTCSTNVASNVYSLTSALNMQ